MMSDNDTIVWKRVVDIVKQSDLPLSLPKNLENLINSRIELTRQLQDFSEDIRARERTICFVKTIGMVGTILGTGLTMTTFSSLGAGVTFASSLLLDQRNARDLFDEKEKNGALDEMLKRDKALAELFISDMKKIDVLCEAFLRQKVVTSKVEGYGIAITMTLFALSLGAKANDILNISKQSIRKIFYYITDESNEKLAWQLWQLWLLWRELGQLFRDVPTTLEMFELMNKKAAIIAGFAIVDWIVSLRSKSSCRATAAKVKKQIDDSMPHLIELKNAIDNFPSH